MPQIDEESLLFDGWKLSDVIESDIYSKTYRAVRKDEEGKPEYAAIRHYSVSETDLAKRFKNKSRMKQYCGQLKRQLVNGLEIQKRFNDEIYIVRCYEYEIKEKTDCIGFDLYARFELLNSLQGADTRRRFNGKKRRIYRRGYQRGDKGAVVGLCGAWRYSAGKYLLLCRRRIL